MAAMIHMTMFIAFTVVLTLWLLQVRGAAEEVVKRFPQCAQAWLLLSDAAAAAHGKTASIAVLRESLNHCGVVRSSHLFLQPQKSNYLPFEREIV
jgi:hypothetical protein